MPVSSDYPDGGGVPQDVEGLDEDFFSKENVKI
jgi:hypothetical protein